MKRQSINRRDFIGKMMITTAGLSLLPLQKAPRWQLGCFTRPWAEHDYLTAFDGIAAAGFKYAGMMGSKNGPAITKDTTTEQAARVGEEAKSRGLQIASFWGGEFGSEKSVAEGIAGLKQLIDNSVACGCRYIVLGGTYEQNLVENYYKAIAESCSYAREKNVFLTIKPHGPFNSTGTECRSLIEKINHKNFRLWYDPGNIYYYSDGKTDPVGDAAGVDGMVVGMSVKDFRMPKDVDVTPGTGMVNFPGVISQLKKGGFAGGPLIVECLAKGDLAFINSEALKARKFLEGIL
jgi:sugar phosphate isomerase/epimerase